MMKSSTSCHETEAARNAKVQKIIGLPEATLFHREGTVSDLQWHVGPVGKDLDELGLVSKRQDPN